MKGERTIDDKPFRYGGFMHDYDSTSEEWAEKIPETRRCYICGGKSGDYFDNYCRNCGARMDGDVNEID